MNPVFSARRRAEEFDSLVEATSTGAVDDARYAELLEVVGALRSAPTVEPRPAFVADLRERLMVAAETELAGAPAPSSASVDQRLTVRARPARERRLAAAMGGFALVGATTSMAVAAQSALPGDALYPLKRAIENVQTGFSVDDGQKGATLLANASGRLEEVDQLARQDEQPDVAAIEDTLAAFTTQATEASDLLVADYESSADEASLVELEQFTAESLAALDALAPVVPAGAQDSLVEAGRTLTEIDAMLQQLCDACQGAITSVPQWLLIAGEPATHAVPDRGAVPAVAPAPAPAVPPVGGGAGTKVQAPGGTTAGPAGTPAGGAATSTSGGQATGAGGAPAEQPAIRLPQQPAAPAGGGGGTRSGDGKTQSGGLGGVVGGLTGGGGGSVNTGTPSTPPLPLTNELDQVVEGTGELVDEITQPLLP